MKITSRKSGRNIRKRHNPKQPINDFFYNFSIVKELALQDFRIRYRNSFFGYFWSIITPLIMLITLYAVFSKAVNISVPYYQLFLLLGIVLWNFFSDATTQSMNSMLNKKGIIGAINFPKRLIVISSCISSSFSFLINLFIFFIFMIVIRIKFSALNIMLIPILVNLLLLVLGTSFFLAALNPRFRDTAHLWNIFIIIGFWITPIIYKETQIPQKYLRYYMLNPMARLINEARDVLIYSYCPDFKQLVITFLICLIIFIGGVLYFNRRADYINEEI